MLREDSQPWEIIESKSDSKSEFEFELKTPFVLHLKVHVKYV